MEISAQKDSKGILYEGYTDEFKLCIFEDGVIQGRNERYEFRCDAHLECCGRQCCTPVDATIPLWLLILFIILGLLLLLALLSALAYWLSKRPKKPKKVTRSDLNSGYRTIRHIDDDANNKEYSALDETANRNGYGNRAYDRAQDLSAAERGRRLRRRGSESDEEGGGYFRTNINPNHSSNINNSHLTRFEPPRRNSWHEHETYEEEFKEEIEYERSAASSPSSSRERLTKI
jgi:hypothetical protein